MLSHALTRRGRISDAVSGLRLCGRFAGHLVVDGPWTQAQGITPRGAQSYAQGPEGSYDAKSLSNKDLALVRRIMNIMLTNARCAG